MAISLAARQHPRPSRRGRLLRSGACLLAVLLLHLAAPGSRAAEQNAKGKDAEGDSAEGGDAKEDDGLANAKYTVVTHTVPRPPHRTDFVRMRDKAGTIFDCVLPTATTILEDSKQEEEAKRKEAAAAAAAAAAETAEAEQQVPTEFPSLDSFLAPLVGRCFLRNEGYWNFEVCHRKRIRQFHEENRRASVEYSLGDFDRMDSPEVQTVGEAQRAVVKHFFEGGTRCDESDSPRHAVIQYKCAKGKENHIETIKETSTCSYTIVFHTPLLCKHPLLAGGAAVSAGGAGKGSGSAGAVVAAKNSVRDYLTGLAGTCFYRVEGWWTYEFCYEKHLKQFHQENNVNTAEFLLGVYRQPAAAAADPDPDDHILTDDAGKESSAYYLQHYQGGTVCDVTGQPRSLEVHFKCATDSLNVIASIKEKSTCKYILVFYTPLICNHPQFQPKHDVIKSIECYPVAAPAADAKP